jgi:ATP-dependent DNA ligase
VISGYTEPEGSRKFFGALLVGFYQGKQLKFCGRVGTGFTDKLLRSLASFPQHSTLGPSNSGFAGTLTNGQFSTRISSSSEKRYVVRP